MRLLLRLFIFPLTATRPAPQARIMRGPAAPNGTLFFPMFSACALGNFLPRAVDDSRRDGDAGEDIHLLARRKSGRVTLQQLAGKTLVDNETASTALYRIRVADSERAGRSRPTISTLPPWLP